LNSSECEIDYTELFKQYREYVHRKLLVAEQLNIKDVELLNFTEWKEKQNG